MEHHVVPSTLAAETRIQQQAGQGAQGPGPTSEGRLTIVSGPFPVERGREATGPDHRHDPHCGQAPRVTRA